MRGVNFSGLLFACLFLFVVVGVSAQNSELTISDVFIQDLDIDDSGQFLYFVGENISNDDIIFGKVAVSSGGLGSFYLRVIGSNVNGNVLSLDYDDGVVWIGLFESVQRWSNLGGSVNGLKFASNVTFYNGGVGSYYREVLADSNSNNVVFTCRIDSPYGSGDFKGVEVLEYNSSVLKPVSNSSLANVSSGAVCRGLDFDGSNLFVDNGDYGVQIYRFEANNSLSLLSSNNNRVYFQVGDSYFGRSDIIQVYNDYLFVSDGGTGSPLSSEAIQRIDVSNASNPVYNNSECVLTGSAVQSKVQNLEVFNESTVLFVDKFDSSIYLCEFYDNKTTFAVEVWDNPDVSFFESSVAYGNKLEFFSDGSFNYFFSDNGQDSLLMFELKTYFDEGLNAMPYFVAGVPDSEIVDNLNPIAVGVETFGLDSPVVNVYPLSCVHPITYDCVADFEGDNILFAVDPDINNSVFEADEWFSFENYQTSYNESGNYTMRVYITDVQHPNAYVVYRDIDIEVFGNSTPLADNQSTLKFVVKDSVSGVVLPNVYVDVAGEGSGYTNVDGKFLEVVLEGVWLVDFSLSGYVSKTNYYSSSPIWQEVFLDLEADSSRRTLVLTVQDSNSSLLSNVFVQIQMPLISGFDYKFTDASGKATFFPDDESVVVVVDVDGYDPVSFELSVPLGSVVSRLITLSPSGFNVTSLYAGQSGFELTGCQDYIRGVILCDYDNVSCSDDSDCVTGKCSYNGRCSNFNWKLCDEQNIQRGNRCIFKNVFAGVLRGVGDWILENFFYVLIMVLLLLALLIFTLRSK